MTRTTSSAALAALLLLSWTFGLAGQAAPPAAAPEYGPAKGALVIAGGALKNPAIYQKFIDLAGGPSANFIIVPTAGGNKTEKGDIRVFEEEAVIAPWVGRGLKNVRMLHTPHKRVADTEEFVRELRRADAVWFDGGRQWNIVDSYAGTRTYDEFHKVLERGGVIGGSSAGATIQGDYLVRGAVSGSNVMMAPEPEHQKAFCFLRKTAIDQHLNTRNRWDDLVPLIQKMPELVGIGLSEDTAIIVQGDRFEVMGRWKVAVHDNTRLYQPWEKPYLILSAGDVYNLKTRRVERLGTGAAPPRTAGPESLPTLLPRAEQVRVREGWLTKRHEMLLPLLRKHGVGMWVVVNEEFHDDPLTEFVAPPRPYCGNRDIFIFVDAGPEGLKKFAVTGYSEETVERFFEVPAPGGSGQALRAWVERFKPQTIALGIGGRRGVTRSLTHDSYKFLAAELGPEAEKRFVSAAALIEDYLDTRIPEEFEPYAALIGATEALARRALSNEVITPGRTTVGDVRRWLFSQSGAHDLDPWFQPDLRLQRRGGADEKTGRGFLQVAKEATVIERGDVIHLDFGLTYMGLNSDWQKMAYVLREGETDAPAGLKQALTNTNALQDALARASRPDRSVAEVAEETMAEMKARGITAMIYSHPLGNQGHALGASINARPAPAGARPESKPDPNAPPPKRLRLGSYLAMELNTSTPVAEWGGQSVTMMAEDPVHLTPDGWKFFRPRQEALYLIK